MAIDPACMMEVDNTSIRARHTTTIAPWCKKALGEPIRICLII